MGALTTQALVISGTVGVGKTAVLEAIATLLERRGLPCAFIDLDWLGQALPAPDDDPYNNRLILENLAAVWPNYQRRGLRRLVAARVVEDPADRERFSKALGGAEVTICHLTASESERRRRLEARELDPQWRDWFLRRTAELATSLEAGRVYDFTVENDDRTPTESAELVANLVGWR